MSQTFRKIRNATLPSAQIPQCIGELRALACLGLGTKSAFAVLKAACLSQMAFTNMTVL